MSLFFYTAFGLNVQSELDLGDVPQGTGAPPDLIIKLGLVPRGRTRTSVDEEIAVNTLCGRFHIRDGKEIIVEPLPGYDPAALRIVLLGRMLAVLMRQRGWLSLHGSAVAIDGRAAIFVGASGCGKSTTAAAFYDAGFDVLADDVAPVRVIDGQAVLCPSWPRLRLSENSRRMIGTAGISSSFQFDKHDVTLPQAGIHRMPETVCIYILDQGESVFSEEVFRIPATALLSMNSFIKLRQAEGPCVSSHLRDCAAIAALVPVRRLFRPVSMQSLPSLVNLVAGEIYGG